MVEILSSFDGAGCGLLGLKPVHNQVIEVFPYKTRLMSSRHEKITKLLNFVWRGNSDVYRMGGERLSTLHPNPLFWQVSARCSGKTRWDNTL
jgi:hypothetical protein